MWTRRWTLIIAITAATLMARPLAGDPPTTAVSFNGSAVEVPRDATVATLLAVTNTRIIDGRVIDVVGNAIQLGAQPAQLLVNNRSATTTTRLHPGDDVALINGANEMEPSKLETLADGATNPQYVLGTHTVTRRRGLISDRTTIVERIARPPRVVALTFDDGPDPRYTPAVLDILHQYGIRATFFCVGLNAGRHKYLIDRMIAQGMQLGDHTWDHPRLGRRSADSVRDQLIRTGGRLGNISVFRPPYADFTPETVAVATSLGLRTVLWDVDSSDWRKPGVDAIVDRVLSRVQPGSIILMHDGGGDRSQTVAALRRIVPELGARGYGFTVVG